MTKFVILAPHGVRTGGPEACFQLSDSLIRQGFDAEIWLLTGDDVGVLQQMTQAGHLFTQAHIQVPNRPNPITEYAHYQFRPFAPEGILGRNMVFVLPEVYAFLVPLFQGYSILIWWLSVDNAFSALSKVNLNHLRLPSVNHACQSIYARQVTEALGFRSTQLTDFSSLPEISAEGIEQRKMKLCLNSGHKVIFRLDLLSELIRKRIPEIEIVNIVSMSSEEVSGHFSSCRLFVDLGMFPGKDRMVREALLRNSICVITRTGAGMNSNDFPLPDIFKWDMGSLDILVDQIVKIMLDPKKYFLMLNSARDLIRREKIVFDSEVLITMQSFLHDA